MKVFFLVMDQMSMPTMSSTKPLRELRLHVTFDESNGSQVEQVDSSVVGKEDPPYEAIKQLAILDHKKMKSLKWCFLKLLLHQFPLTYLMLHYSKHLLQL